MTKTKKIPILLIVILFLGLILRVWGINFGLPFQFHQDEPIVVNHSLAYGSGDLNPHFFAIPPFTSYLLFFIYGVYFLIAKIFGIFKTSHDFAFSFFKDPTQFYLLGRIFIGVIPGVLCIFFTYKLYKELFQKQSPAIFAAAIIAFSFLNVSDSHYIYTDMLLSLAIIISMIRLIKMFNDPSSKNYFICAVFIGLAMSIKYNAALLVIPFFITHVLCFKRKSPGTMKFLIGLLLIIAVNFVTNPFAWIDCKFFLSSLAQQTGASGYVGWLHHISYSLRQSLGVIFIVSGFLGIITLFVKEKIKALVLFSFPVVFYLHLVFLSQPFARYILPIVPFIAIGAGYFVFECIFSHTLARLFKILIIFIYTAAFIFLITKSVKLDMLFVSKDTRVQAGEWIKNNISPNSCLAFDNSFFRPVASQTKEQILAKRQHANKQEGLRDIKDKKIKLMLDAQSEKGFCIYFLNNQFERQGQFLVVTPAISFDFSALRNLGIGYIAINYTSRQKQTESFYDNLNKEADMVYAISPYRNLKVDFSLDPIATTGMPVLSKELFRRVKNGPALEIYKLKK